MTEFVVTAINTKVGRFYRHDFRRKNTALEYAKMLFLKHPEYAITVHKLCNSEISVICQMGRVLYENI